MTSPYLNSLEAVIKVAVGTAMSDAAEQLPQRSDCEVSPDSNATNVAVSFDSSWKTRGLYFSICFGALISTDTKKGYSRSFQQVDEPNPYNLVKIRKEECKTHVVKRLKKKRSTINTTYVPPEWMADSIAANYSTVIYQHRGLASIKLCSALHILVDNVAGDHSGCPTGEKSCSRWRNTKWFVSELWRHPIQKESIW
ncbi:hypothetical protein LOD99_9647 [Oopsacas minuta]|uniref:Mutator-like transposase domain-containing protein n=1 Tax=Oopsacas minuta TaxID=111878 RepID=A0AAV7KKK6_9METZ|nr:hypothetical protein LOD99_9647 [Oopsacas minuta]